MLTQMPGAVHVTLTVLAGDATVAAAILAVREVRSDGELVLCTGGASRPGPGWIPPGGSAPTRSRRGDRLPLQSACNAGLQRSEASGRKETLL